MPPKKVSLKDLERKQTETHKEEEARKEAEEKKKKCPPTEPIVIDVMVVGDESIRMSCMLTELEQRNTHVTFLGLSRMTQLFCAEKYWMNVNFVTPDEFLFDPFLINTITETYHQVIVTYTYGNQESLRRAKKLMQTFATKDGSLPIKKGQTPKEGLPEVNITMEDESVLTLPEPPLTEKIGPGILVGVNTKAYVKGEEDNFPAAPSNTYTECDPRLPDEAHKIAEPYGVALYLGEEDADTAQDVYAWIFETFVKLDGSKRGQQVQKYKSTLAPPEERTTKVLVDMVNSLILNEGTEEKKGRWCSIQ